MKGFNQRIRAFFSYYKPYKKLFFADLLCAFLSAGAGLALPLCIRRITQAVSVLTPREAQAVIFQTAVLILLLIIANTACTFFYDSMGHIMGARMERDMRNKLFGHYLKLPFSFFDREKTGSLMSRITGDLLNLAELYHHGPENFFIYICSFAGALVLLFRINFRLTLIVCLFLPVMALYSLVFLKKLNRAYRESREKIAEVNADLEDCLSGIRTVKSFANEEGERKKFGLVNEHYCLARSAIYRNEACYYTVLETFFIPLITSGIAVFGGMAISQEAMSPADLIAFLLYAGYLTSPIPKLAWLIPQFQDGMAAFNRFMDIMDMGVEEDAGKITLSGQGLKGDIRFEGVSFQYQNESETVLNNLFLDIKAGEYIAVVGPSGAGKTTLCSLIPRYYEVKDGSVYLEGLSVKEYSLESLRRSIGIVQQDVYLFAGTVSENIAYGRPGASEGEIIAAAKKANAHEFITALPQGYHSFTGHRGVLLSGGQRQRISIARVFLKDPPILIFDEATSALDNDSEEVIRRSLADLSRDRTTLVIAHRLSTIRNARRILVLTENGIAEQGVHRELLARGGIYARLYRSMD
jgi:ATP-binding cassette subfamily B protein